MAFGKNSQHDLGSSCLSRRTSCRWAENRYTESEMEGWLGKSKTLFFRYHLVEDAYPIGKKQ